MKVNHLIVLLCLLPFESLAQEDLAASNKIGGGVTESFSITIG